MAVDYILDGQPHGEVATQLHRVAGNPHAKRPFLGADGRSYVNTLNQSTGKLEVRPVYNATAVLRKDEWKTMLGDVVRVAKPRLKAWGDLQSAGLSLNLTNAFAKTVLEYERQSDITPATISMDGVRRSESDRPVYDLRSIPLPIIHKDFDFTERQIEISRNGSTPLPSEASTMATRRVTEEAEKLLLGTRAAYSYAGGTLYGYRNFPERLIGDITHPDDSSWTPKKMVQEILAMRQLAKNNNHHGPFFCYTSPGWDEFLDEDYSDNKGDNTLRQRIGALPDVSEPMTLDYLPDFEILLVERDPTVVQAVTGMGITAVQWGIGDGVIHFKVMAIMVPLLKVDQYDQSGIVHAVQVEPSS